MSSAILYLAIVAIWAVVLVPRWIRRPHEAPQWVEMHEEGAEPGAGDAGTATGQRTGPEESTGPVPGASLPPGSAAATGPDHQPRPAGQVQRTPERAAPAATRVPDPYHAERRTRVLRARRVTLFTLSLLTVGAVALAAVHLAAWWLTAPPVALLAVFVLLLREAARIDAERAAARARAAAQAGAAHAGEAAPRAEPAGRQDRAGQERGPAAGSRRPAAGPPAAQAAEAERAGQPAAGPAARGAEIIDISGRVGDQLYDQYSDAEARAIGD